MTERYAGIGKREVRSALRDLDLIAPGARAFTGLFAKRPDLDNYHFRNFVVFYNRADRDAGELDDIAQEEIDRLVLRWDVLHDNR